VHTDLRTLRDPLAGRIRLHPQNHLQEVLHERDDKHRRRIIAALDDSFYPDHRRWAQTMNECASAVRFYVDPQVGRVRPWINRCRHKLCPFCGRARTAHVAGQIEAIMRDMKHPRAIILTVRSSDHPLRDQVAALRRWFRKLRSRSFWKERVRGGVYTMEITINEKTQLWHPHLHVVYDGTYMPFKLLQKNWHDITQGSEVVWVQDVKDAPGAARELAKYIGKIQQVDRLQDHHIRAYADGVNRSRMVQTFGNTHGKRAEDHDPGQPDSPDTYTLSLPRILHLANLGAGTAQRLLLMIGRRWPVFARFIAHELPQLQPADSPFRTQLRAVARITGKAPPVPEYEKEHPEPKILDADIFLAFTRIRLDDQSGVHDTLELQRYGPAWPSS